jgi:hypothetical protein
MWRVFEGCCIRIAFQVVLNTVQYCCFSGLYPSFIYLFYFIVYLTTLFQYIRHYNVDVGGKPAASAQFILNPDSSARGRAI